MDHNLVNKLKTILCIPIIYVGCQQNREQVHEQKQSKSPNHEIESKPCFDPSVGTCNYVFDLNLLKSARALQCKFDSGFATTVFANGTRKTINMELDFGLITYDMIDTTNNTAREISNNGIKNMYVLATDMNISFIEITSGGNPIFTTVFSTLLDSRPGVFIAVTSRHITPDNALTISAPRILGFSQYYGSCTIPIIH